MKDKNLLSSNPLLPAVYYVYGGMKQRFAQKTRLHICDDYGKVLCGVKSNWMEAGEPILENGFEKGWEHLFSLFDERSCTCKRCLKEWCRLNGR